MDAEDNINDFAAPTCRIYPYPVDIQSSYRSLYLFLVVCGMLTSKYLGSIRLNAARANQQEARDDAVRRRAASVFRRNFAAFWNSGLTIHEGGETLRS